MTIVAGMLLICMVKISGPSTYGSKLKDVPTKILHITEDGQALVEYDFKSLPYIQVFDDGPFRDLVSVEDITGSYMNCKEVKNGK